MTYIEPTIGQMGSLFAGYSQDRADDSLAHLNESAGEALDLSIEAHRQAVRRWLSQWLCRLRVPKVGERDVFSESLDAWWGSKGSILPRVAVDSLTHEDIAQLAEAYGELARLPGAQFLRAGGAPGNRTIAPTAASKIMFAVRPEAVPPWDVAIARETVGGTTVEHFRRHLTAAQRWAAEILDKELGKAIPYGVYDLTANTGWVNVGVDHDTAAFAVASIRRWRQARGGGPGDPALLPDWTGHP